MQRYYYIPLGISVLLCIAGLFVFSTCQSPSLLPDSNGTRTDTLPTHTDVPPADEPTTTDDATTVHGRAQVGVQARMKRALRLRVVWAGFLLIILAFASTDLMSGWITSYLVEERGAAEGSSRFVLTGLWGGIALGRMTIPYVLERRLSERKFVLLVLVLTSACAALIWGIHNVPVDAVAMVLVGFCLG